MKTWEQLGHEATRYANTIASAACERLLEMDRVVAENPHRAHELEDARRELVRKAVRDAFLDGGNAARDGVL